MSHTDKALSAVYDLMGRGRGQVSTTRKKRTTKITKTIRTLSAITIAAALGILALIRADAATQEIAVMRHTTNPRPGYGTLTLEIGNDGAEVQVIGLNADSRIVFAREGLMSTGPTFEGTGAIEGNQHISRDARVGIAYMLLGIVLLPVMNAIAKSLTADYPLTQVVWARFLGHLVWVSLFFGPLLGVALLRAHRPREMIGRSFVFFASNFVFIAALPYIQLATASAIMFTTPLVVVALSALLLKERVGPWRSAAVVVGFCGALVIIRPVTDVFQPAAVLTLLSAICFAGYQLWTRRLAQHERPETLIIHTALAGAIVMSLMAPFSSALRTTSSMA